MRDSLTRRTFNSFIAASAASLLVGCAHSGTRRFARIGFMIGEGYPTFVEAFRGELRRLGYAEGGNLVIEERLSGASGDLQRQAAELIGLKLDVIVAAALPQALELKRLGTSTPVVVATAPGFVANGLARSLERPGANFTGIDELPPGLTARRLRILATAAPHTRKVALLSTTPGIVSHGIQVADADAEASKLGVMVKAYRASSRAELELTLAAIAADGMQGLVNFQGGLSLTNRDLIVDSMRRQRIPAIYQSRLFVESGGLMAFSPDQEEQFRTAARYAHRIVSGASPGDLPILHPGRYYLTINRRSADSIGLTLHPELLKQAHQFIG
jgi:putative tryptophan/tyrosine transport system substrate-binding protein